MGLGNKLVLNWVYSDGITKKNIHWIAMELLFMKVI